MRRAALVLFLVALVAGLGLTRVRLEAIPGERVPAELLYLPEGPYLRALALGHEETLADLIYIWAIQYYSNFDDATLRFQYLEKVFGDAIAELDPLFDEVFLVGAMIMSIEAREPDMALRLYDKGLEHNPEAWQLAYWAGWECYLARRYECARDYWARAVEMPEAPSQLMRLTAAALAKQGDLHAALARYQALYENPPDEKTKYVAERWVRRLQNEIGIQTLETALDRYREREGRCPPTLENLLRTGDLAAMPQSFDEGAFTYDPAACRVSSPRGSSVGRGDS